MRQIFYISDLHLGHKNAIAFDQRPFWNIQDMEQTIIQNWNSVVARVDVVYVLGDMFWKNEDAERVLPLLNGEKHLILGNHDSVNSFMQKHFKSIKEIDVVHDEDKRIVVCHYPIAHWRNADHGWYHFYGHIHNGRDSAYFNAYNIEMQKRENIPYLCYNVGCMMPWMNYTPRTFNQIVDGYTQYMTMYER